MTMGLLDSNSLNEWAMAIPDRAKAMYQGLLNAPAELKEMFTPQFAAKAREAYMKSPYIIGSVMSPKGLLDTDKNKALATALEATGMAPMGLAGHIVYHSTPHYFTKFDMSKIGTGEGAQAYGHGLYVAESPAVSGIDGEYFNAFKNHPEAIKNGGPFAYKVDIPDEAIPRMLDWDKPLSEQPEVLAKAKQLYDDLGELYPSVGEVIATPGIFNGQHLYQSLINSEKSSDRAAKTAKALGIPGIRYLDGMSRNITGGTILGTEKTPKGWVSKIRKDNPSGTINDVIPPANSFTTSMPFKTEQEALQWAQQQTNGGTSNYVLFDDALARILEINGQPTGLLPWADDLAKKAKK